MSRFPKLVCQGIGPGRPRRAGATLSLPRPQKHVWWLDIINSLVWVRVQHAGCIVPVCICHMCFWGRSHSRRVTGVSQHPILLIRYAAPFFKRCSLGCEQNIGANDHLASPLQYVAPMLDSACGARVLHGIIWQPETFNPIICQHRGGSRFPPSTVSSPSKHPSTHVGFCSKKVTNKCRVVLGCSIFLCRMVVLFRF